MNFPIGWHIFQGKKRRNKENVVGAKPPTGPPYTPPYLEENIVIFLTPPQMGNFHHLNPLHTPFEACRVA